MLHCICTRAPYLSSDEQARHPKDDVDGGVDIGNVLLRGILRW